MNNLFILISLFGFSTLINAAEIPVQEKVERKCGGKNLEECKKLACEEARVKALVKGLGGSIESNNKSEFKACVNLPLMSTPTCLSFESNNKTQSLLSSTEEQLKAQTKSELSKVETNSSLINDLMTCEIKAVIISTNAPPAPPIVPNPPISNSQPVDLEKEFNLWFQKAFTQFELGEYEAAIKNYNKALEIKPNNASAWFNRGLALERLKRNEEAFKSYDNAIKFNPNDADAWYSRGVVLRNLGRYEEAVKSYDNAIKFNPNDADAWVARGVSLYYLKRYDEALESYNKALKIDPNIKNAKNNRKLVLEQMLKEHEQKP